MVCKYFANTGIYTKNLKIVTQLILQNKTLFTVFYYCTRVYVRTENVVKVWNSDGGKWNLFSLWKITQVFNKVKIIPNCTLRSLKLCRKWDFKLKFQITVQTYGMDCNWWKIVEKQEEILVFLPLGTRTLVMKLSSQFCLAYLKSFLDHGVI